MLHEFVTMLELGGAKRETLVRFEWDQGRPLIDTVELCRSEHFDYDDQGRFSPHMEYFRVDVTRIMESWQLAALAKEIQDDAQTIEKLDSELAYEFANAA